MASKIVSIDRLSTNENMQKALAIVQRFMLVSDGDGHNYVIPLHLVAEFDAVLASAEEPDWSEVDLSKYEQYALNGSPRRLTFTDPQVS